MTQQPPVLASAVLPKCGNCSRAALAACLPTRINAFPYSHQLHHLIPLPCSVHFREANKGFTTIAAGLGSQQRVSTVPCPANEHYCSPHHPAKLPSPWSPQPCTAQHEVENRAPQATQWHSKVCLITARRKLHPRLGTQANLHDNSWL